MAVNCGPMVFEAKQEPSESAGFQEIPRLHSRQFLWNQSIQNVRGSEPKGQVGWMLGE